MCGMCLIRTVFVISVLCVAAADEKSQDVATVEPPPDVEQDRRPAVRTNMPPHLAPSYSGSPVHHDLKTLGSSDYAYTYSGDSLTLKKEAVRRYETSVNFYQTTRHHIAEDSGLHGANGGSGYEHFNGGSYDHGGHHDHFHVVEDHGPHDHGHYHDGDEYHITSRDIAFGFLTFMIILTNLQSGLINLSKNDNLLGVITSRKRREASKLYPMSEVPDGPLPFPTKLDEKNWLLVEDKQVRCVQHSVCATNRQLVRDMGSTGRALGHYLSHLVAKSVDAGWARLVADAGAAGLAGVDCSVLYRGCHSHLDIEPN